MTQARYLQDVFNAVTQRCAEQYGTIRAQEGDGMTELPENGYRHDDLWRMVANLVLQDACWRYRKLCEEGSQLTADKLSAAIMLKWGVRPAALVE